MKRIVLFLFIIMLLASCIVYAEELIIHTPTKEELGGVIQVTGEDGNWETYTGIDTYEKLYEVLEDVDSRYSSLLQEYTSLNESYEELKSEKDERINELELELEYNINHGTDDSFKIFIFGAIIFVLIIIIPYFKK